MINLIPACLKTPENVSLLEGDQDGLAPVDIHCNAREKTEAREFYPICEVDQVTAKARRVKPGENLQPGDYRDQLTVSFAHLRLTSVHPLRDRYRV